ncbi:MAG: hypothetical protein R3C03_20260 [Pirellulaceae bacterium]
MTQTTDSIFKVIDSDFDSNETKAALDKLAEHFRQQGQPHRLFEVLKMQNRLRHGLKPVSWKSMDDLPDDLRQKLEEGLLDACQEAGLLALNLGQFASAWNYLEPLNDRVLVRKQFEVAEITEENSDEAIEVLFHHGAHPALGMQTILKYHGTCNAITIFDSSAYMMPSDLRAEVATVLISHFCHELLAGIKRCNDCDWDWATLDSKLKDSLTFVQALSGVPHVDATHLNSVVRIGRFANSDTAYQNLTTLCRYGQQLPAMLHFAGEGILSDHYCDHLLYFDGLLGTRRDIAISEFTEKLSRSQNTAAFPHDVETIVAWIYKMQEYEKAIEIVIKFGGESFGELGLAPGLMELATHCSPRSLAPLMERFQRDGDALGYAMIRILMSGN